MVCIINIESSHRIQISLFYYEELLLYLMPWSSTYGYWSFHNPFKIILTSFLYKCPIQILVNYQKYIMKLKK